MKHIVTELEEEKESISFTNNILGNYCAESYFENFTTQLFPFPSTSICS